jgi:hypothetical protein
MTRARGYLSTVQVFVSCDERNELERLSPPFFRAGFAAAQVRQGSDEKCRRLLTIRAPRPPYDPTQISYYHNARQQVQN